MIRVTSQPPYSSHTVGSHTHYEGQEAPCKRCTSRFLAIVSEGSQFLFSLNVTLIFMPGTYLLLGGQIEGIQK